MFPVKSIFMYDTQLDLKRKFVLNCKYSGEVITAISADRYDNLYAFDDIRKCVHIVSSDGEVLRSFENDREGENKLDKTYSISVSDKFVYVPCAEKHKISVFTTEGEYVTSFGEKGSGDGQFKLPHGVHCDKDGFLYVCDTDNDRILIF